MVFDFALIIFLITYAGVAIGEVPGLALDRTGIALLGAILMVVFGVLTTKEAILSIDISTILLLYGLMVLSSQFRLGGFYTWTALKITKFMDKPERFLLVLMIVSAVLSAILANDIVCLAFTPVLTVSLLKAGLNPIPFLIGLAVSSNIGSASTIILTAESKANLLLIDDADGRKIAQGMDLKITGTVGILLMAAKDKKLDLKNSLDYLLAEGFRLSEKEYQRILKLI